MREYDSTDYWEYTTSYDENGNFKSGSQYKYNKDGIIIERDTPSGSSEYEYNEYGLLSKMTSLDYDSGIKRVFEYIYKYWD